MKKALCIILSLFLITGQAYANDALQNTAEYIYTSVPEPQFGSIGGEWTIIGLARSGYDVPQSYYDAYYKQIEQYVTECNGVLHNRKYTEYSRLIIALTAIDKDPTNVAGYNLLTPLGDYDKTILQGINGPIWALIALDCGNYTIPANPDAKTQATRDMYIDYILSKQLSDGGFALRGTASDITADADITGMAIQAFSDYLYRDDVKQATEKALNCLSTLQSENGGFETYGNENCESCVQAIVALCEMGIPLDDPRFVKNGCTLLDNLMSYHTQEQGFKHTKADEGTNLMASEQSLYALTAIKLANEGKSLYNIKGQSVPSIDIKLITDKVLQILRIIIKGNIL